MLLVLNIGLSGWIESKTLRRGRKLEFTQNVVHVLNSCVEWLACFVYQLAKKTSNTLNKSKILSIAAVTDLPQRFLDSVALLSLFWLINSANPSHKHFYSHYRLIVRCTLLAACIGWNLKDDFFSSTRLTNLTTPKILVFDFSVPGRRRPHTTSDCPVRHSNTMTISA